MNGEKLKEELFLLVGFLLTSAHGLYDEPAKYGPLRLIDATHRLLVALESTGLDDPFLADLREGLDAKRSGNSDAQSTRSFLDLVCVKHAEELNVRLEKT
ncbi:MAG: DUF6092 family protein [Anaerolineales bacterium]